MESFEWDESKRRTNLEKHGVDFLRATEIFSFPTLEAEDDRLDYGETRYLAIGRTQDGTCLCVVYTWRGQTRRLISAWKGGRDEQSRYETLFAG